MCQSPKRKRNWNDVRGDSPVSCLSRMLVTSYLIIREYPPETHSFQQGVPSHPSRTETHPEVMHVWDRFPFSFSSGLFASLYTHVDHRLATVWEMRNEHPNRHY